ncbi:hypothetical protein BGX31_000480, partial [Mortierella sp. GBA43]
MQSCPLDALTLFIDRISTASSPRTKEHDNSVPVHHPVATEPLALEGQIYSGLLQGPRIDILAKLPYETAVYILQFIDLDTLIKAAAISRTWYHLSSDNE